MQDVGQWQKRQDDAEYYCPAETGPSQQPVKEPERQRHQHEAEFNRGTG